MSTNESTSQTTLPLYIAFVPNSSSSPSSSISASESSSVSSTSTPPDQAIISSNNNLIDDGYLLEQSSEASNEPSAHSSEEATTILDSTTGIETQQLQRNIRESQGPADSSSDTLEQPSEASNELSAHSSEEVATILDSTTRIETQQLQRNIQESQELASEGSSDEFSVHSSTNSGDPSSSSTESSLEQPEERRATGSKTQARSRANQLGVASGHGPIIMARGSAREIYLPAPSSTRNPFAQLHPAWQHLGEIGLSRITGDTFDEPPEAQYQQTTLATPMLKDNVHWGDLPTAVEDEHVRVWFQNIQGLPWKSSDKFNQVMTTMKDRDVTIMGFNEPNVTWTKQRVSEYQGITRKHFGHGHLRGSESGIKFPSQHKPGGTLTVATGKWTARITESGSDPRGLGRWSFIRLQSPKRSLVIITAYRPHKSKGPSRIWTQQYLLLRQENIQNPDPIQTLYDDLNNQIKKWREQEYEILLMLDANEVPGLNPGGIGMIAANNKLIDLHRHRLGFKDEPATYARGKRRVDYMFGTQGVAEQTSRVGCTPFGDGLFHSDHRGLFVDINLGAILTDAVSTLDTPATRLLSSKTVKERSAFIQHYDTHAENQNIHQRSKALGSLQPTERRGQMPEANKIDLQCTKGMLSAEQKSCSRKQYAWSPRIKKANVIVHYWKQVLSMMRTGLDKNKQLQDLAKLINRTMESFHGMTAKDCDRQLREAQRERNRVQKQATELRDQFLTEQLLDLSDNPNAKTRRRRIHQIRNAERKKQTYARIKTVLKPRTGGSLAYIMVPKGLQPEDYPYDHNQVTEWENIYDPNRIQEFLLARNKAHFGQAEGTPFTQPPLSAIGISANSELAEKILAGDIPPELETADEYAQMIIEEIVDNKLPPISSNMSKNEIKRGFRKWRESTSTSPSGRHLGLWRSLTYPPTNDDEARILSKLWEVHTTLLNIPFQAGQPLDRWKTVVNAMLEKISGKPYLHKLRVIHLLEADYNLALKMLFGRRLMWHCEEHGTLHDAQDGSRPGRWSHGPIQTQVLMCDINRRTRTNHVKNENDARACYDRLILELLSLVDRANGMPEEATETHAELLDQAEYHVKSKAGISDEHYSNTKAKPIHGNGQGAGDSPNQFGMISSVISRAQDRLASKAKFQSPDRQIKVEIANTAFVDDTSGYSNDPDHTMLIAELVALLQADITHWGRLLWATGGQLELEKCLYYAIEWKFRSDGSARIATPAENQVTLRIQQQDGTWEELLQKHPDDTHKLLGVEQSPSGNQAPEAQRLRKKSDQYARLANTSGFNRTAYKTAYYQYYLSAMNYSLYSTWIKPSVLDKIQISAKQAFLTGMGYNRNMHLAVVYGSPKYGGIGMQSLSTNQGILGTISLLRLINSQVESRVSNLSVIDIMYIQMEAGTSEPILEDTRPIPYLEPGWIPTIRQFLHSIDAKIVGAVPRPTLHRLHDSYIMDHFLRAELTPALLAKLNRCRIALRVARLSDIATSDGKTIDPCWFSTKPVPPKPSISTLKWPRQLIPDPKLWNLWRNMLTLYLLDEQQKLRQPLGPWTSSPLNQMYRDLYDPSTGSAFSWHRTVDGVPHYNEYRVTSKLRRRWNLEPTGRTIEAYPFPRHISECIPAEMTGARPDFDRSRDTITGMVVPSTNITESSNKAPESFIDYLHQNDPTNSGVFSTVEMALPEAQFLARLLSTKLVNITSDGGAKDGTASFGWLLSINHDILVRIRGPAEGHPDLMQSFRSEGYGSLSVAAFIHAVYEYFDIAITDDILWHIRCDNSSLIKRLAQHKKTVLPLMQPLFPDYDVTLTVANYLDGINYKITHVRGHQDNKVAFEALPESAQHNVLADELATTQLNQMAGPVSEVTNLGTAQLVIKDRFITSKPTHHLREAARLVDQSVYLREKFGWSQTTFEDISWTTHSTALKSLTEPDRVRITKYIHGWLPTGKRRHREKKSYPQDCALCHAAIEDNEHLWACTHESQIQLVESLLIDLEKTQHETKADPALHEVIKSAVRQCALTGSYQPDPSVESRSVHYLFQPQGDIGWHQILHGRISQQLIQHQDKYYHSEDTEINPTDKRKFSGQRWAKQIILTVWRTLLKLWKNRCERVHGRDERDQLKQAQRQYKRRVQECYDMIPDMPMADRHMFDSSPSETLNRQPHDIELWLHMVEALIKQVHRERRDPKPPSNTQDIRQFFQPRSKTK